ncbi:hypothetical protein RAC89_00255 [Paenibacillus sp. GD4]|uniref:hypothetical protein n=1 Tax=Paenibacillus sp. GD4 TaxID=3068890 RepID=UPI002796DC3E|nr:hypothetical protein [Paenibacillus sp. GD4]MDQ1908929.1 hypothetical protein [Paenibacillus sp. GD4]
MDQRSLEEQLAHTLQEGEMERVNTQEAARKRLPRRTEVRIQAEIDPVVEETKQYRKMAQEVDSRYAKYDEMIKDNE